MRVGCGRGEVGLVRIGIFSSLAGGFLAELLRIYAKRDPGVRIDVVEGGRANHISCIQRLQLDVAFLTGAPSAEGCDSLALWIERVFLVVPSGDGLANANEVRWSDLRDRRLVVSENDPAAEIHEYLMKHLGEIGHTPSVERHGVGRNNLMHLVAFGKGLTLVSEAVTASHFPGVAFVPLSGESLCFSATIRRCADFSAWRAPCGGNGQASVPPEIAKLETSRTVSMLARVNGPCASSQTLDRSP